MTSSSDAKSDPTLTALEAALGRLTAAAAQVDAARATLARARLDGGEKEAAATPVLPPWRLALATAPTPLLFGGLACVAAAGVWVGGRRRRGLIK